MTDFIQQWPWLIVLAVMIVLILAEDRIGSRSPDQFGARRISDNFILYALGFGTLGLIGVGIPGLESAPDKPLFPGFGLASQLALPGWAVIAALFLADSFIGYWLHRFNHTVPCLWRIHRVHHCDPAQDASSAVRNHPLEMILAYLAQVMAIALVSATSAQAIVVALANVCWSLMTHADLGRTPLRFPPALQILVSPAYHRVHHSELAAQTDSNYANMITAWDHVFGTARDPELEDVGEIGLGPDYAAALDLRSQLALPFRRLGAQASHGENAALVRPPATRLTRPHPEAAPDPGSPGGL